MKTAIERGKELLAAKAELMAELRALNRRVDKVLNAIQLTYDAELEERAHEDGRSKPRAVRRITFNKKKEDAE